MQFRSTEILERFRTAYGKDIDLTLRPAYRALLEKLGNPQSRLAPVFHVAGTNGKGSTCAFLRSILEAHGYKVHVHTSPHLIRFHERIRIAGELITENELLDILRECESKAELGRVSYFELATAATFVAFSRHLADFTILETGLGGRLDATNVVPKPLATIITRLSYDHREYLGNTMEKIAFEKAGIMRPGVPCFSACQPVSGAEGVLRHHAAKLAAPFFIGEQDWKIEATEQGFSFEQGERRYLLPRPALIGAHQLANAGLALAALSVVPAPLSLDCVKKGMGAVAWPARLQRLEGQRLVPNLPSGIEVWLDGGHNDSAGEVLSDQVKLWRATDKGSPRPLCLVLGMLSTKQPKEFVEPFSNFVDMICLVPVPDPLGLTTEALAALLKNLTISETVESPSVVSALQSIAQRSEFAHGRILICGSLYLAGSVLALYDDQAPLR